MARTCGICEQPIAFLDAQISSTVGIWHTRCWNDTEERQATLWAELDDSEGFPLRYLPEDGPLVPARNAEASEETKMATAPTNTRTPREVVDFPLNAPVTVALKYNQGRTVSGQNGERMMFSLVDGRVMFLDPETAGKIVSLGVNVRESFTITRKWDGTKGVPTTWEVARVAGEQPNGTFTVPALSTPSTDVQTTDAPVAPKPPARANAATDTGGHRQPGSALVQEANSLVDAYAQVMERALTTYQGRVKPDEIRTLVVTAYIQRGKLSSVA